MPINRLLGLINIVSKILRPFAETSEAGLNNAIDNAIERIGAFTGVDQSYVFQLSHDTAFAENTHQWCIDGNPRCHLGPIVFSLLPEWHKLLMAGEHIYIPVVGELPDSRIYERNLLSERGVRSVIIIPLVSSNKLHGFIGFESLSHSKTWDDVEITLLRSVADIIISALVRTKNYVELTQKEHRFRMLMEHSSDVITIINAQRIIVYASGSINKLLGGEPELWLGQRYDDVVHACDVSVLRNALGKGLPGVALELPDFRIRSTRGDYRWFSGKATDLRHDESVEGWVINAHDITLRKKAEQALLHQASHDSLTGLANRALLLEKILRTNNGKNTVTPNVVGLLFIDLDHFKVVNDSLGHAVGDQLLMDVAIRLQEYTQPGDTIARFGGDEFVLLLGNYVQDVDTIVDAATKFLRAFDAPFQVNNRERLITASAGLVIATGEWEPGALLRDADAAMYQAKAKGRNRLQVFDEKMQIILHGKVEMANDLRNCESRGELYLLYQPVYDIDGETLKSVEALVRWKHPEKGIVSPADFIPVAEDTGMILPIGVWVLNEALRQMRTWLDLYPNLEKFSVAINLSTRQLVMPGLAAIISEALSRHGVSGSRLSIEITESALMNNVQDAQRVLHEIQELGCCLAIDDFGTGYSSMAYLRDLPVTCLKIDRSFVNQMLKTTRDRRLVAAMVNIAIELGMETIAEGVETAEQMDALRELNCTQLQGFYLMRPSLPNLIEPLLAKLEYNKTESN